LKAIEIFENLITDLVKVKYVKEINKNEIAKKIEELKNIEISVNYRNSLIFFLNE